MRCRLGGMLDGEEARKGAEQCFADMRDFSCSRGYQTKDTFKRTMPL